MHTKWKLCFDRIFADIISQSFLQPSLLAWLLAPSQLFVLWLIQYFFQDRRSLTLIFRYRSSSCGWCLCIFVRIDWPVLEPKVPVIVFGIQVIISWLASFWCGDAPVVHEFVAIPVIFLVVIVRQIFFIFAAAPVRLAVLAVFVLALFLRVNPQFVVFSHLSWLVITWPVVHARSVFSTFTLIAYVFRSPILFFPLLKLLFFTL